MKPLVAVTAGLLFLAGTGMALAEQTAGTSENTVNQVQKNDQKGLDSKLNTKGIKAGVKFHKTKKFSAKNKLGKKGDKLGKIGINPQPEPPKSKLKFGNGSEKVELNPQPEPPMTKSSFKNASGKVQLNPQPEPPKPVLGGSGKGFGTKH